MSARNTAAIGAGVIMLAIGANQALMPSNPHEFEQQQRQSQTEQLADSQERETERRRDAGNDHLDAELQRRNVPGEHRPPDAPHIRIRLP